MSISLENITVSHAARHIASSMRRLNGNEGWDEEERDMEELELLRHNAMCLLRKADPLSIPFARVTREYRHTDYPSGGTDTSIMFNMPVSIPVAFHFLTEYQVM